MPGAELTTEPLSHGDWDIVLEDEPEWAVLWAGLACFMTNLVAPVVGSLPQPVCFVGGMGSAANVIGKHLASELGMLAINSSDMYRKARSWRPVEELVEQYGYPVWVNVDEAKHIAQWPPSSDWNINLAQSGYAGEYFGAEDPRTTLSATMATAVWHWFDVAGGMDKQADDGM